MEAGQLSNINVGYIIQARMKSTRLPGKVLMKLPFNNGKSLLKWITDTLKKSSYTNQIIVATSVNPENDILEMFCAKEQIEVYRGDEDDVLSRFVSIIKKNNFDIIVRLTADNPIVDLTILENVIGQHLSQHKEYTKTEGLPVGMNFEIIKPSALLFSAEQMLTQEEREHVTLHLRNHSKNQQLVNIQTFECTNLRLTIDYPSDFATLSLILSCLKENEIPSLKKIKELLKKESWMFEINQSNIQKKQFATEAEERIEAIALLQKNDFNKSAQRLLKVES